MGKISRLDVTSCILATYRIVDHRHLGRDDSPLYPLMVGSKLFFISGGELDGCKESLSMANRANSHVQHSIKDAFTLLLTSTTLVPSFPNPVIAIMGIDRGRFLERVTSGANWKEHQTIQALTRPALEGTDLFGQVVMRLIEFERNDNEVFALLAHIYEVMMNEQNPVLESKNEFICDWIDFIKPHFESDSESDSESLASDTDDDQE
jgi:hypothetical protein